MFYALQKRHRQDDAINNRLVEVYREGRFVEVRWTEVSWWRYVCFVAL